MHIGHYTLNDMLMANWTMQEFYDIIDETTYQTKNWDVVTALGVARALYTVDKSLYQTFPEATLNEMKRLSHKVGWFSVYKSDPESDSDNGSSSCESNACFVSDCDSCSNASTEVTITDDSFSKDSESDESEAKQRFKPDWMTKDKPKVFSTELLNKLETFTDLKQCVFCVTGMMDTFNRDQLFYLIRSKNGVTSNHLTKQVDFLIVGKYQPGKTKLNLAKKYGTKLLTEQDILILLTESHHSVHLKELNRKLNQVKVGIETFEQSKKAFQEVLTQVKTRAMPSADSLFDGMDWNTDWNILDVPQVVNRIV